MNPLYSALLFYLVAATHSLASLWRSDAHRAISHMSRWHKITLLFTVVGFVFHTVVLLTKVGEADFVPFATLGEAVSFFSWALVLIFLVVELKYRVYVLGSFVLPLSFLSLLSSGTFSGGSGALGVTTGDVWPRVWLGLHTTLSLSGIVSFAIAAIAGAMYLLQEHFLKYKQFNTLYFQLPSLDLLDRWNKKAILFGFPLLTLGMIFGGLWARDFLESLWSYNNPKMAVAAVTWLFYLLVLHGRITVGWRAKQAAHLAMIGFIGAVLIFVTLT